MRIITWHCRATLAAATPPMLSPCTASLVTPSSSLRYSTTLPQRVFPCSTQRSIGQALTTTPHHLTCKKHTRRGKFMPKTKIVHDLNIYYCIRYIHIHFTYLVRCQLSATNRHHNTLVFDVAVFNVRLNQEASQTLVLLVWRFPFVLSVAGRPSLRL